MAYLPDTTNPRSGDHPINQLRKATGYRGGILEPSDFAGMAISDAQAQRLIRASEKAHTIRQTGNRAGAREIIDAEFGSVINEMDPATSEATRPQYSGPPSRQPRERVPAPTPAPELSLEQLGARMCDHGFSEPSEPSETTERAPGGYEFGQRGHEPEETDLDKIAARMLNR